jgi:hypothetical protein
VRLRAGRSEHPLSLLLDAAVIAEKNAAGLADDHPDRAFYTGKKYAALYFAQNVLPMVAVKAQMIGKEERSSIEIPDNAFATL